MLSKLDRWLARFELGLAVCAMTSLVVLLIAQVIFRYLLQSPLFFAEEVALLLLAIATFCGLSLLVFEGKLISVTFAALWLSKKADRWLRWAMQIMVLALALSLVVFAWRYLSVPWVWNERSATINLPRALIYAAVALEMVFLAFHQAVRCVQHVPWQPEAQGTPT